MEGREQALYDDLAEQSGVRIFAVYGASSPRAVQPANTSLQGVIIVGHTRWKAAMLGGSHFSSASCRGS